VRKVLEERKRDKKERGLERKRETKKKVQNYGMRSAGQE